MSTHKEVFKGIIQRYLGREWKATDGLSEKVVEKAEARLGFRLPPALRGFYLTGGALPELCSSHNLIFEPKDLDFEEGYLVFMDENQSVVSWGIKKQELKKPDPIIWQRNNTSEEWYSEEKPLAELLTSMFDFYQMLGVWKPAITMRETPQRKVTRRARPKPRLSRQALTSRPHDRQAA